MHAGDRWRKAYRIDFVGLEHALPLKKIAQKGWSEMYDGALSHSYRFEGG